MVTGRKLHPDLPPSVDAHIDYGGCWPNDRPFPLTPEECMAVMMGYAVRPAKPLTDEEFALLPGKIEGSGSDLVLWRA